MIVIIRDFSATGGAYVYSDHGGEDVYIFQEDNDPRPAEITAFDTNELPAEVARTVEDIEGRE